MKKLTIGSLKNNGKTLSIKLCNDQVTPPETKKVIEIEQHEAWYRLEIEKNQSILDTALKQGIALDYKCKQGTCGKCKIKVLNGHNFLQASNQLEEKKLHM